MSRGAQLTRLEFFDSLALRWDDEVATPEFLARLEAEVGTFGVGSHERVLDLGCGTGNLTALLLDLVREGRVIGLDISRGMLDRARSKVTEVDRVEWVHADVVSIPLGGSSVDRVICLSTWPHFTDPVGAATEVERVLRPGGHFHILHLDGREVINDLHRGIGEPVGEDRLWPAVEVAGLLEGVGLVVTEVRDEAEGYLITASKGDREGG